MSEQWVKAAESDNGGGGCVEICVMQDGSVKVADTKQNGEGAQLEFDAGEWAAFVDGIRTDRWVPSRQ